MNQAHYERIKAREHKAIMKLGSSWAAKGWAQGWLRAWVKAQDEYYRD